MERCDAVAAPSLGDLTHLAVVTSLQLHPSDTETEHSMRARVRSIASTLYRRAMYLCSADFGFRFELHPDLTILSPSRWCVDDAGEGENRELFFGYYDKSPWSSDMSRMLLHRRLADGAMTIAVYDRLAQKESVLATSSVWNWQQGSMAQWLRRGSQGDVIFNDIVDGQLVSRIVSVFDEPSRLVRWPIQAVHPEGNEALTLNYCRLDALQPEYGYGARAANFSPDLPLADDGIWQVNLQTGEGALGLSLLQLAEKTPHDSMRGAKHHVNHFCYSPNGDHVVFLHRWVGRNGRFSRLYLARKDLSQLRLLLDEQMVSHYSWRDDKWLIAWARTAEHGDRYYLLDTDSGSHEVVGRDVLDVYGDGHPSFSPDRRWLLTDSYPDKARQRHLLLFSPAQDEVIELGRFFAPWRYDGDRRCDLHPRWSPDGQYISVDSAHSGLRLSYVLDVRQVIGRRAGHSPGALDGP